MEKRDHLCENVGSEKKKKEEEAVMTVKNDDEMESNKDEGVTEKSEEVSQNPSMSF